jgi:O-acetylhomoserine (thiol)-lyase
MGIKVNFVNSNDLQALGKAINQNAKAVYAESIGNPNLDVVNFEGIALIARNNGIPFVLDSTVSPYPLRTFDYRVDTVIYSATKFIGGHGTSLRGVIVDSGKFY